MTDDTGEALADGLGQARGEAEDLDRLMRDVGASARTISGALSGGLKQALVDGRSLDQVFRSIALSLSRQALSAALSPIGDGLSGGIASLAGGLASGLASSLSGVAGAVSAGGPVTAFAKGGVVATPSYFPLGNGAGLMGEAGAEAILPLARDGRGRLGVAAGGVGEAAMPAIVFNVEARDAESFARSETQIATMVARAVGRGRRGL